MSLLKTLTQVAIGIAVAKGVQHVTNRSRGTTGGETSGNGRSINPGTGRTYAPDTNGMGGIMDEILGAGKATRKTTTSTTRQTGGLEDILNQTTSTSRTRKTAPKGGLEDLLGGALGGAFGGKTGGSLGGGGLGDLLGAVLGGAAGGATLGRTQAEPEPEVAPEDEAQAAVLLRAMIQAAKADGKLDAAEKAKLMEAVGQAARAEIDFINRELAAPVDIDGLLSDVPRGMEEKVYMVSVMAIDLDERAEAEYLHELATALGLDQREVNALHDHMQAPRIYS